MTAPTPTIAFFVSAHGFGHAARVCAVIEALWQRLPAVRCEVFTTAPRWFFSDSLRRPLGHHEVATDVGLVQLDALEEDLDATRRRLSRWLPFTPARLDALAADLRRLGCGLVICDISPLGLAAGRRAGLPTLLVENFTWDWIYRGYGEAGASLAAAAGYLEHIFAGADRRVQTEPLCRPVPGARRVPPIARRPRAERAATRRRLGIPVDAPMVLVTMGGIEWDYDGLRHRLGGGDTWLVIPGASSEQRRTGRAVLLPHRSEHFHPDLIHAADAVVGKLGYSTIAEVHAAGLPFGYVPRCRFPESPCLEAWVERHLPHRRIPPQRFTAGDWLEDVGALLALPRRPGAAADGADEVAAVALELVEPTRKASTAPPAPGIALS